MPGRRRAAMLLPLLVLAVVAFSSSAALAHEERPSQFPPGDGSVPTYRGHTSGAPRLVVCKDDSARRIADIGNAKLRAFNRRLLKECAYEHIQQAVDAVTARGSNIYLLPGVYREEPTRSDPPCAADYEGGAISYEYEIACPSLVNLVTIIGDDPEDEDIVCDNKLCDLQIEGTGDDPTDVLIEGGFRPDGEWVKHNAIKADRADGIYFRNFEVTLFRENGIYVHETDGYVIDDVLSHNNDLYGFLSFASDHGLFKDCEAHHNGDSGVYPGSAADVNATNTETGPLERWAAEVDNCNAHHNAIGFSGTAGNSVYIHDSDFHHNGIGMITDSFLPNHPGMPQDHDWLVDNRFYSNNQNYYVEFVQAGKCAADVPPAERGYENGTVCPAFLMPVGTGLFYAGGNYNFTEHNDFYDNWRFGAMLAYAPPVLRDDYDIDQFEVSNHNHFVGNRMGFAPGGLQQPNGLDFWWDD